MGTYDHQNPKLNLAHPYEDSLAAQHGEPDEESMAEQYKDLIQSQKCKPDEDGMAEQYKDLIQSQKGEPDQDDRGEQDQDLLQPDESDLDERDVKLSGDQADEQTGLSESDIIDERCHVICMGT